MTTQLAPCPVFRANDNNGNLLSGGKLFTYSAGTTTPLTTYTDSTGATPNQNPVILNSRGEASVWLTPGLSYKFVLSPSTDTNPPTNPFWTVDNIPAPGSNASGGSAVFANVAAVEAYSGNPPSVIITEGYYAGGDSGAAMYAYVSGSSAAASGAVLVDASGNRYFLQYNQPITPLQFGSKGDGVTDDSAALQAMFNYIEALNLVVDDFQIPVNGAGRIYATSQPLQMCSNITLSTCTFLALAGTAWSGNSGNTFLGYGTNGIISIGNSTFSVTLRDVYLDCNRIQNVQCIYCTATGSIRFDNVQGRHWVSGGNGCILDAQASVMSINMVMQEWESGDAEFNIAADANGIALGFFSAEDSTFIGGNYAKALVQIYVDPHSHHIQFTDVHPWTSSGTGAALVNPYGVIVDGFAVNFNGTYLDSCPFLIRVSSATNSDRPNCSIRDTQGLYNASETTFPAWITITTSLADTPLFSVYLENNSLPGAPTAVSLQTTGSGSYEIDPSFVSDINSQNGQVDFDGPGGASVHYAPNLNLLGVGKINGDLIRNNVLNVTSYTITIHDTGTYIDIVGVNPNITLPNDDMGIHFHISCRTSAGTLTAPSGGDVNGASTLTLSQNHLYHVAMVSNPGGAAAAWKVSG